MGDTDNLPARPSAEGAAILQIAQELSTRIGPTAPRFRASFGRKRTVEGSWR